MVGAVLGAAVAATGCRQRIEPVDRDVNVSHHQTVHAGLAQHELTREGRHHRRWMAALRARATPVPAPAPARGERRPPVRVPNGCATSHEPGHGVVVRCVRGSGDDIDRTHEAFLSGSDPGDGDGGDGDDGEDED
ncbi:hypothetical protein GCM10010151_70170 [Actinoallomurus spadix]|uniref:Lipoprotein n=2 Tax=Actinoallomurus spadix TaxID=79912 RepID=A0ABN0XQD2_9ACTN